MPDVQREADWDIRVAEAQQVTGPFIVACEPIP